MTSEDHPCCGIVTERGGGQSADGGFSQGAISGVRNQAPVTITPCCCVNTIAFDQFTIYVCNIVFRHQISWLVCVTRLKIYQEAKQTPENIFNEMHLYQTKKHGYYHRRLPIILCLVSVRNSLKHQRVDVIW